MKKHVNYDDIPDKAEVNIIYADGSVGRFGIVKGANLHYMLRGYTLDKEFGLWYGDKQRDYAYEVIPL